MFLGKTVVHGLYALCYLSRLKPGTVASSAEVSEAVGVPPEHTRKILTALGTAGLIKSNRGRLGGCVLARPLREVTLLDVLDALQPAAGAPALERRDCPVADWRACSVQPGLAALRDDVRALFRSRTLADVMGEECRPACTPSCKA